MWKKVHNLTKSGEVPVCLQHHIYVKTPLERIQQNPLILSEVNVNILIGHWILEESNQQ